jgi:biopolymer transport protein ExbB/TolQ
MMMMMMMLLMMMMVMMMLIAMTKILVQHNHTGFSSFCQRKVRRRDKYDTIDFMYRTYRVQGSP